VWKKKILRIRPKDQCTRLRALGHVDVCETLNYSLLKQPKNIFLLCIIACASAEASLPHSLSPLHPHPHGPESFYVCTFTSFSFLTACFCFLAPPLSFLPHLSLALSVSLSLPHYLSLALSLPPSYLRVVACFGLEPSFSAPTLAPSPNPSHDAPRAQSAFGRGQ
jgi:hypothetical protein